jgi:choline dehydrogenase
MCAVLMSGRKKLQGLSMWDYVVVGAGSAGCVVANRLSESPSRRVLLLEAGDNDQRLAIKIPAALGYSDALSRQFDWGYWSVADPSRNNRSDHWWRGRVVGGSSSINGMLYARGSAADYDRWAALGNRGWSAREVMPVFQALEHSDRFGAGRGRKGPVHLRSVQGAQAVTRAFLEASQHAGFQLNADYNGASQEGMGYAELTQRGRLRWSAADAFLRPALRRRNLRLITQARVHRLRIGGQRVSGVCYEYDGSLQEAPARHVVLCAGALNTPQLLMLSGIGGAEELRRHGIEVMVDRTQVGRNLREHPVVKLTYRMNCSTFNPTEGYGQKAKFLLQYLLRGQGPLATIFEATGFLKTVADLDGPDIQLHFMPVGLARADDPGPLVLPFPGITVLLNKSHPLSSGEIRLADNDPRSAPLIECRLLSDERDLATLVRGVELVRRIMKTQPIAGLVEQEVRPGEDRRDSLSIQDYVRNNTELAFHPVGTCRMGVDEEAVVSPELRVRGVDNLWIADASIMPDLISGNTNAVCMMIGEKLGRALAASAQ